MIFHSISMGTSSSVEIEKVGLVFEYCRFKPALFYQVLQPWHIADGGLDFKLNMKTGVNEARFPSEVDLENGPKERLDAAIAFATQLVDSAKNDEDAAFVEKKLLDAASWGDNERLQYILRSCYVTESSALPALAEVCRKGFDNCVHTLLAAGVSPIQVLRVTGGNNCFHIACQAGQEQCAALLIQYMKQFTDVDIVNAAGYSAFQILRHNDMVGIARRLEAQVALQFADNPHIRYSS